MNGASGILTVVQQMTGTGPKFRAGEILGTPEKRKPAPRAYVTGGAERIRTLLKEYGGGTASLELLAARTASSKRAVKMAIRRDVEIGRLELTGSGFVILNKRYAADRLLEVRKAARLLRSRGYVITGPKGARFKG